jgi:hypothetical protein
MNKKIQSLLLEKFTIITVIILVLVYIYISIPNDILMQKGGAPTFKMPPNTPMLYKYRFAFIALPFLLLGLAAYYAYYAHVTLPSLTVWDLGHDFFANFQKQYIALVANGGITADSPPTYASDIPEGVADKDQLAFYNTIQISADPLSGLYTKAQYFCGAARPCGCCTDNKYLKYFFNCDNPTACEKNAQYIKTCKPNNTTSS